jgi:hypothetical protein
VCEEYTSFIDGEGFIIRETSTRGRPHLWNPVDCLGLGLVLSFSDGSMMILRLLFGMTMRTVTKYLQFARRIVIKILRNNDLVKISIVMRRIQEHN